MSAFADLPDQIAALAVLLQDPYRRSEEIEALLRHPLAQRILAGGEPAVQALLGFLHHTPPPYLARVAVLLLAGLGSETAYRETVALLGGVDPSLALAFEDGLWRMPVAADKIASDLVAVARRAGQPVPILLLQRPAAAAVKPALLEMVRTRREPLARYAMTALGYALEPADTPFLAEIAGSPGQPSLSAPAGIALLRLGSAAGWPGIEEGLTAADQELRVATFSELRPFLPAALRHPLAFDPRKPPAAQHAGLARLRETVTGSGGAPR